MTKQSDFISQFRTLIVSHNKCLTSHPTIPIAGISVHQMDHADLRGTSVHEFLFNLDPLLHIELTPATPTLGKWHVFTTVDAQTSCEVLLDDKLSSAFTEMLLMPEFPRFPAPTRLPTISPPVDYIAAIMADADSNLNAWHRAPPQQTEVASTGSTLTRTLALTIATHINELMILMETQQESFNSRIPSLQNL
jgi:hypothetical protein